MKQILVVLVFVTVSFAAFSKEKGSGLKFDEVYRSQYHFSTDSNRMGSVIAFTSLDTTFHVFYQYNPFDTKEGYVNWGHSVSNDLVKWVEQDICIKQTEGSDSMLNTPWWGSVVKTDKGLISWVTFWGDGIYQMQSTDGITWNEKIKTRGTENLSTSEPFVFWHKPTQKWVMFNYDRTTKKMSILLSNNGIDWVMSSSFNYNFGYPQFFEMQVDRKPDDTRWVLLTEKGTYIIGTFDGEKFEILTTVQQFNKGKNIGGSAVFFDSKSDRMLMVSELKNDPQNDIALNSQLSLVNDISLHTTDTGIELWLKPVEQLSQQFDEPKRIENKKVYPGINNNLLKGISGTEMTIKAEIGVINCDQFGFLLRTDRERNGIEINFNLNKNKLNLLGTNFDYTPTGKKIEIQLLIDRSVIEVYIDGGKYVVSSSVTPDPTATRYELYTMGGEIMINWLEVGSIQSVWNPEK